MTGVRTGTDRVTFTGVSKSYGTGPSAVPAVSTVDLTVEPGEFVCLVGPSGCGKTTLLQMLAGFESPTTGTVDIGGVPVTGPGPERGVVFQKPNLFPWKSVRANVELGPKLRGVPRAERRARADRILTTVGLSEFGDRRTYELSGGMQQRAQIARVLVNEPRIILMDEPFGALDALTREKLQTELLAIRNAEHRTVLFVTHSVDEAVFLGTRVLVMSARPGRIVEDVRISLPGDEDDAPRSPSVRTTPEFAAYKERIASEIYRAHA
ncbi:MULTISPECIES: ABC transporter ATP-binding protein [Rhodococcus]|uniref:ABC transporter ATP-binding protein n=1 Tax=Rhodococcus rhodochrous TaxID=1829 RepID=A0AA47A8Q3_RHORH|nr:MULTISPECIES: ABC transporter ATP-binding protein [Rhodococcus]MBH0118816.1 ABC transporter ATP-binding protein [Rhodococcus sp. CX]MCK8674012.1 ABC transporter ATP-binding protein [Rhodococcus sp. HM1]UZF46704.1 ABC transporter ATP-binding protein [Rhodococcus rhodochrous]